MLSDLEAIAGRQTPGSQDRGLAFLRDIDQRIAASHPERLRYPPVLLAEGLVHALKGADSNQAALRALHRNRTDDPRILAVVERFGERLRDVPPLRSGVREGLEAAALAAVPVTVVTEERLERCVQLIRAHGFESLIRDVLSIRKTVEAFRELKASIGVVHSLMVGDQIDRDIEPPKQAGFETFLFRSAFVPYWNVTQHSTAHHCISQYDELVPFFAAVRCN
jgi:putative hydrolase of the HAD superfamily